ncbi:MAG TPA: hypothetical protein VFU40_00970 [Gemmatimonadales bacterium]|nr:hypothetical protein [Gemmatimonadales bacterium]
MQWLKRRWVLFGVCGALACAGEPTGNQSTPTEITANPGVVFVTQGDSQAVILSVVDEDGQVLEADFGDPANVGSGISVVFDPNFQTTTTGVPIHRQARYFVKGVDLAHTSFTVQALGLTKEIEVFSIPGQLAAEITDSLPALGDTITITAPTGTFFSDSSVLTFTGVAPVVVSQDATTITFIPFPNIFTPAVVSNVGVESNPDVVFSLSTPFNVKTDSILDLGPNVAPTNPALGAPVTLTLPAGLKVIPESLVQSGVGADTLPRGLGVASNPVQPRNITVSADSATITFVPPPNADSFVVVPGIVPQRLAACCGGAEGYPLVLGTTVKLVTPVVDSIPATLSTTTPAANVPVTVTRTDPSFAFDPDAAVLVGADDTPVVFSVAGDGSSLTFLPTPGSTGRVTVDGVTIAGFSLTLPAKAPSITVGAVTEAAGTDDPGTAPALPVPGPGETVSFWDIPDFEATVDHFYRFDVPAAGNYRLTVNWDIGDDIDAVICTDVTCATLAGVGNGRFAAATATHPESGVFPLAAGANYILVEDFGGADDDANTAPAIGAKVQITIDRQ